MTEVLPQGALEAAFPEYIEVTNDPLRQGGRSLLQLPGKKRILTSLLEPVSCGIGSCAYSGAFWFPARTILFFELLEETAADCRRNLFGCSKTLWMISDRLGLPERSGEAERKVKTFFRNRGSFRQNVVPLRWIWFSAWNSWNEPCPIDQTRVLYQGYKLRITNPNSR